MASASVGSGLMAAYEAMFLEERDTRFVLLRLHPLKKMGELLKMVKQRAKASDCN
jgi:hypothetical protein